MRADISTPCRRSKSSTWGGLSPQPLPARPVGLRSLQLVAASAVRSGSPPYKPI